MSKHFEITSSERDHLANFALEVSARAGRQHDDLDERPSVRVMAKLEQDRWYAIAEALGITTALVTKGKTE